MSKLMKFARAGLMVGGFCVGGSFTAQAETTPPAQARQAMIENHKKASEMHSKMAACLASDKTVEQCREDMVATCGTTLGANCPMIGGKHAHGKGRGKMGGGPCMGWMLDPGTSDPEATPGTPTPK